MLRSRQDKKLDTIITSLKEAKDSGIIQLYVDSVRGKELSVANKIVLNFGSCSYLGLEHDQRLMTGAINAIKAFGTQFSSSRSYAASGLYKELEFLLSQMVGGKPVLVAPTTTLAHASVISVLIGNDDAVLYDAQVHASVQMALPELIVRGIHCEALKHNDMVELEKRITELAKTHDRVFYLADGVYSMHGDVIDVTKLNELMDKHPKLYAYVDDAHGVSWHGINGSGTVLEYLSPVASERTVVVLGLAKGFASCGGAIVFPNHKVAEQVRFCGKTMIFSGPLQPAQLGAGIESAKIHLSEEIYEKQHYIKALSELFNQTSSELSIPNVVNGTPIKFVQVGETSKAISAVSMLLKRGYYTNIACYPAVARGSAGIRIVINCNHTTQDIESLLTEIKTLI